VAKEGNSNPISQRLAWSSNRFCGREIASTGFSFKNRHDYFFRVVILQAFKPPKHNPPLIMKLNLVKWNLMLTTLPVTLLVLSVKLIIVHGLQYEGLVKFSEIGLVITGGIFLIGFMLAGTISDFKESEKIPSEIACTIETIEDTLTLAHGFKGGFDLSMVKRQLNEVTESILNWFKFGGTETDVFEKINSITRIALTLEKAGVGAIASRVTGEQHNLRKLYSRVNVIKKTSFLSTGYALLEVLIVIIIGLLLIAKFENQVISTIIVCFLTQIFIYMIRLIKDVDQPFEYSPSGKARASDIDLFPLIDYNLRAKARI
jgi:hypothetical protein